MRSAGSSTAYPIARSEWEIHHARAFPGRRWGVEQHCSLLPNFMVREESRVAFANRVIKQSTVAHPKGAEIGACQMPVKVRAHVTYIEAPPTIGGNFNQTCLRDMVADAQNLSTIASGSYDFVIAAILYFENPYIELSQIFFNSRLWPTKSGLGTNTSVFW